MDIKKLFRSFRQKLILENGIKSFLLSLMTSGIGIFITSLVYHVLQKPDSGKILALVGGVVFAVSFALSFTFGFPIGKKVAARIDALGLQERVGTMLELEHSATPLAQLQRKDAISHLERVKASQIKFNIGKREWVLPLVTLTLALIMVLIPHDFLSFGANAKDDAYKSNLQVSEFIDKLRNELKESAVLDQEMKDRLEEIVEELEESLEETDDAMEQAAKIEEAKEKVDEAMEEVISKDAIGEELKKYELTRPLGEAIMESSEKKVQSSLGDLEEAVKKDAAVAKELSRTIAKSLEDSGVKANDELYLVLEQFSLVLKEVIPDSDTFEEALQQSFDDAERDLLAILKKQKELEKEKEKIKDAMDEAKKEALEEKKGDKEKGEEETSTEEGEGEKKTEEGQEENQTAENKKPRPSGGDPEKGDGSDSPGGSEAQMTESIFDPISGSVSYGEVFALYYAEYLEALEKGEVSEELQAIMDRYYSTLNR